MSTKFEIDFSEALRQLAEFQAKTKSLGGLLDKIQADSGKPAGAAAQLIREMHQHYSAMERTLEKLGADGKTAEEVMKRSRNAAQAAFAQMAADNLKLTTQTRAYSGELQGMERLLKDSAAKQAYIKWAQKTASLQQNLASENRYLVQAIKAAGTAEGQYNERLKAKLATNQRILNHDQMRRLRTIELESAIQHLGTEEGRAAASAELRLSATRRATQEDEKRSLKITELQRLLASLNGGQAEEIATLEQAVAARKRKIRADNDASSSLTRLTQAQAEQNARQARATSELNAANKVTQEAANTLHRMTEAEAKATAQAEALAAATKKHNNALMEEARSAHGMSKAQKELADARQREIDRLTRLRQQKDLLTTSYGQELAALQRQIQEQQRYNRLLAMTTAELLGFTSAQRKAATANFVGSQSAAMMRAGLAGLHTSIGMYTSATILAASATYAIASGLRSSITLGAEFSSTMARVSAIMSTSTPSWLGDTGQMDAMEKQVRALGQTTVFTANEVSQGLMELGMAGLSAGDAMLALQPSLDLAQVGNVSMAQSADMSTNIMMAFGKEARDLTHIVDVMATAVTNSNTTFEQLANALTYAGPAAHAAGISLEDTVAATEALANAGFKGSRAGTGLRRLITSLLNPTKKGAEVLREYGIATQNADGSTRSLVDVVGQLGDKLNGLPGNEKISAIQNLVGIYATPQVAALVNQAEQLKNLRRGLDDVANATVRMKQKMEDSLKTDWRMVVSAFEEAQLSAFESQEWRLREASARLSSWLIDLKNPIAEGSSITELDLFLQRAENAAVALSKLVAGFLAFKAASAASNLSSALASDMSKAGDAAKILAGRIEASAIGMKLLSAESARSSLAARILGGAWTDTKWVMNAAAVTARWLAVSLSVVSKAFGWVGLIWGIYEAGKMAFGSDAEEDILNQKGAVDTLKSSYDLLKESMKDTAEQQKFDALKELNVADNKAIYGHTDDSGNRTSGMLDRIAQLKKLKEDASAASAKEILRVSTDELKEQAKLTGEALQASLDSQIGTLEHQVERMKTAILDRNEAMLSMHQSEVTTASYGDQNAAAVKRHVEALKELEAAELSVQKSNEGGFFATAEQIDAVLAASKKLREAKAAVDATLGSYQRASQGTTTLKDLADRDRETQQRSLQAAIAEKQMTSAEKLLENRRQVLEVEQKLTELHAKETQGDNPGRNLHTDLMSERAALIEDQVDMLIAAETQTKALAAAEHALWEQGATDSQKLLYLRQQLVGVDGERGLNSTLLNSGSMDQLVWEEQETELLKRKLDLLQQIKNIQESMKKASGKSDKADDKDLRAAWATYQALRKEYDPVGVSKDEMAEKTKQLELLIRTTSKNYKISAEERERALQQLRKTHYELTLAQDKNRTSLLELRSAYSKADSPLVKHSAELYELNRLYKQGAVDRAEYLRLQKQINETHLKASTDGLPTASLPSNNNLSSPFTDLMGTSVEYGMGLNTFDQRKDQLSAEKQDGYAAIEQERLDKQNALQALKLASLTEHSNQMFAIEQEAIEKRKALDRDYTLASQQQAEKRKSYEQQMGLLMTSAMLGTAQDLMSGYASISEGASAAQRRAWAMMKTMAVAQILVNTEVAAAQAMAAGDVPFLGMKIAAHKLIRTMGYASAGIVGGMALAQYSNSGGGASGAYDDGGFIPYNSYGIVGEYGPEIVHGPANVTSREKSAKKLGSGQTNNISLAPQITVQMTSNGEDPAAADELARKAAEQVKGVVMSVLHDHIRPQGMLDTWMRAQRRN